MKRKSGMSKTWSQSSGISIGGIRCCNNFNGMLGGFKDMMLENLSSCSRWAWLKWCVSWYEDQIRYEKSKDSFKWTVTLGKLDSEIILMEFCVISKIWCWKVWVVVGGRNGWSDVYCDMKIKSVKKNLRIQWSRLSYWGN